MSRRIRPYDELAKSHYLHNPTEVQRFTGLTHSDSKKVYELAYRIDDDELGEYRCTEYVRRKTVMRVTGITETDIIKKIADSLPNRSAK